MKNYSCILSSKFSVKNSRRFYRELELVNGERFFIQENNKFYIQSDDELWSFAEKKVNGKIEEVPFYYYDYFKLIKDNISHNNLAVIVSFNLEYNRNLGARACVITEDSIKEFNFIDDILGDYIKWITNQENSFYNFFDEKFSMIKDEGCGEHGI